MKLTTPILSGLIACTTLCYVPKTVHAQIFVGNVGNGTIGEYTTSGATVNAALISGLSGGLRRIAVSGGDLFVTDFTHGTIGEYTTSGATVNAPLISGLNVPIGIAIASVPDASPTIILLLLGIGATFGLNLLLQRRSEA